MKKLLALLLLIFFTDACGKLRLPAIISNGMVLQLQMDVTIWGWAGQNDKIGIKTSWDNKTFETYTDKKGKWQVKIKTPSTGGPYTMSISNGSEQIELENILIGEVWLCSGQSNMQWSLKASSNSEEEVKNSNYSQIRFFNVAHNTSDVPCEDAIGKWEICISHTASKFSAIGYFFGREIHKEARVPVGLINNSWGGTPAQSWIKKEILLSDDDYKYYLEIDQQANENKEKNLKEYDERLVRWQEEVNNAKASGKKSPAQPSMPGSLRPQNRCYVLYNSMIYPLMPYAIKGVIWYQGESNAGDAYLYRKLFPAMIDNWRADWGQGDFPFYFVQLSNFYNNLVENRPDELPKVNPADGSAWAELREAQTMALSLPNTGMAVTMDIGDPYNIHPTNKMDVGKRLALLALAKDYGFKDITYSGPLYKNMKIENNKIRLYFDYASSGLIAKDGQLKGFTIAGENKGFVWANAQIDDDTIVVWSEEIKEPKAVRYAWANWIECNLFNKHDLPASPFRTDDWQCITKK